jgi:EAL domain-containing protein (putative c-di-GMP-specific phosphodiesterase class I)
MHVVAEGIETKEQMELLCSISCDKGQGYYFSKPLPTDEFEALLQKLKIDK